MAESTLKQRLQDHAKSFDGLLSLIPAKIYYGADNSWKKKKQTKAEASAALRAKLDPDSFKSAKDVMDEKARKRKLEETEDYSDIEVDGVEKEVPRQGLRDGEKKNKKQKKDTATPVGLESTSKKVDQSEAKAAAAEKKREKVEKKKEKLARKAEKKKVPKENASANKVALEAEGDSENEDNDPEAAADNEDSTNVDPDNEDMNPISVEGLVEEQDWSTASSVPEDTTVSEKSNDQSANTSTSSVIPPAKAPKNLKQQSDPEILKKRLADRIELLRAARKADGPARNRAELIESRRRKEEQRRAHKKELRRQAAAEEAQRREEALASARDSPASSMMGSMRHSPEQNFSFGRVAFADGQHLTNDLSSLIPTPKKKGPQDAGTALQAAEKKRQRLAGLDDEKKADIEEKDIWLNARKRANGERVRDDTSLLKKTLKRKEKAKKKSEKEWTERKEGVAKGIAMKQKKREDNLQKRKDGKGVKTKGGKVASKGKKPKSRPGFEGSFTSKKR